MKSIILLRMPLVRLALAVLGYALLMANQSCDNFVEVDRPNSQLIGKTVFEDMTTATAAMSGLYAKLRGSGPLAGNGLGVSALAGMYADELDYYQTGNINFYNNSLIAAEAGNAALWNNTYHQIYEANSIIEGLNNSTTLPVAGRDQLLGESLFVRATLHFYLVNLYGDVPYITTTDYIANSHVSRTPTATVYTLIQSDLEQAISLLPESYVTAERVRPNKFAAYAMLARVCLYRGAYAEASNAASTVLNSPLYVWEPDLNKVFVKNSTTTIWQFSPAANGNNTSEGNLFIFTAGPPANVALRNDFVGAFEANDQRKAKWTKAVTNGANTWYHAYKYKQQASTPSSMEYSVVLRLAEQVLIRAEARARLGELTNAKADLDLIRITAGLLPTTAVSQSDLIAEILNQRRFELFTEFGNRFFDLKRSGLADTVLPTVKTGWSPTDKLWPIPANELVINPNLNPQNPGY
ncbi:RagB/SusD family nutrient uptake outer membrane protein [Flavobacterium silvisoli]|uniref:RagB/SusD family nutrient uptake outer membrane protein n=1 Tax=Flavobacterium silvisoli TaxID=2529433 RepID=A0A4Q9YUV4_9FLAO|nr:RagB/SusD family nutrient uptake outer membrane protein [Flavobacterium silvisoli]TBX67489.1 RagB/SusD family nutrient uptake outer membrane protein [Flavobacterium silvisoli]